MLYKQKGSSVWWCKFKFNGHTYRLSTASRNFKAAGVEARRLRVQVEQERGPRRSTEGVALAALEELDQERARNKGFTELEPTLTYRWGKLFKHLGEWRDATTLTAGDVAAYEGLRRKEGARGQTIRYEVGCLKRGLKLAKQRKIMPHYPFDLDDLDPIKSDAPKPQQEAKLWALPQVLAVLGALSAKAKAARYDEMLGVILTTGLRLNEFRRIRPEWVKGDFLIIPPAAAKTGRGRQMPLSNEAKNTIEMHWEKFRSKKFNHALAIASKKVGLPMNLTPRDLRAFYLSHAGRLDPVAAQRLGGHTNIATTGLYLDASNERATMAGLAVIKLVGGHSAGGIVKKADSKKSKKVS